MPLPADWFAGAFRRRGRIASIAFAALLWLVGAALGTAWQVTRFVEREHARFAAEFDAASAMVAQRLDQNEALLDGLVALLRSSRDAEFVELRRYANEVLQRYHHVHTIGYQPRVTLARRLAFETVMSQRMGRPVRIHDFDFDGSRRWRDSPERPFYYPVSFMAPELPEAQDVIGYDIHDDARFRGAIDQSHLRKVSASTLPFDLVEGGRGYIFLRALTLSADGGRGGAGSAARQGPEHLVSLLIRSDRLFAGLHMSPAVLLTLRHREAKDAGASLIGQFGDAARLAPGPRWQMPLPELALRRTLASQQQPFALELRARPAWHDFDWGSWLLWSAVWTVLVWGGGAGALALRRSHRVRWQAQQRMALAERDLAATQRRAEATRAHSLDELGSGIARELGQPLTAVVGYSQAALRMLDNPNPATRESLASLRATLRAAADQAARAGELVQRLRTLVRKQPMQVKAVTMQEVIASVCRLERGRLEGAGVVIDIRLPSEPIVLQADAMLLEQLFSNLLRNAVDAVVPLPRGMRRVAIEAECNARFCRVTVCDSGPGLTAQERERAFQPFQSTKPGAIGIGLVECAAIAQAHHGDIAIDAASPPLHAAGTGARLIVTLPLASQP